MYEVLLELDDLLETLTCWLSFAAVALSVIVVAACENGCGAYWEDEDFSIGQDGMFYDNKYTEDGQA